MEKPFRDVFKDFELPVEQADFDAIRRKMKHRNRRKIFWILLVTGSLFSTLLGSLILWNSSINKPKNELVAMNDLGESMQMSHKPAKESEQVQSNKKNSAEWIEKSGKRTTEDAATLALKSNQIPPQKEGSQPLMRSYGGTSVEKKSERNNNHYHLISRSLDSDAFQVAQHTPDLPIADFFPLPEWLKPTTALVPDEARGLLWLGMSTSMGGTTPNLSGDGARDINQRQHLKAGQQQHLGIDLKYRQTTFEWSSGLGLSRSSTLLSEIQLQLFDSVPVLNPTGDTIGFFRLNYRDSLLDESYTNRYQYLCIPLKMGKIWHFNAKNSIYTGFGVQWMSLIENDSRTFTADLNALNADDALLKKNLISWNLELAYRRKIGAHWEAEASITHQQVVGGIYRREQNIMHQISASSMQFGIHYLIHSTNNKGL